MTDRQREELEGFIEAWEDDAANCDGADGDVYLECADEIRAFLDRESA